MLIDASNILLLPIISRINKRVYVFQYILYLILRYIVNLHLEQIIKPFQRHHRICCRMIIKFYFCNSLLYNNLNFFVNKTASVIIFLYRWAAIKQKIWTSLTAYLPYWIDKELYKVTDNLRSQAKARINKQQVCC